MTSKTRQRCPKQSFYEIPISFENLDEDFIVELLLSPSDEDPLSIRI